jgi:predicted AAA+ superfamily ATPase
MKARTTPRYLLPSVQSDLEEKMVLLGGPRQVGKTTLARSLPGGEQGYLNWDIHAATALHPLMHAP